MILAFIRGDVRTKDIILERELAAIHKHHGMGGMYRKVNIPSCCACGEKALTNRSDTTPSFIRSIIALCTPPRGLRRPPHKTHRTCQLTRRVDTVDVGDVLDSVLWGESGDNDDSCGCRDSLEVSIGVLEMGFICVVRTSCSSVGQDSARTTELSFIGLDS
jgi:hypothetical protein